MAIYCPRCTLLNPLEMEEISHNLLRCPRCLHTRKITNHAFGPSEIEDISHTETHREIATSGHSILKTVAVVGAVAIGLTLLFGNTEE